MSADSIYTLWFSIATLIISAIVQYPPAAVFISWILITKVAQYRLTYRLSWITAPQWIILSLPTHLHAVKWYVLMSVRPPHLLSPFKSHLSDCLGDLLSTLLAAFDMLHYSARLIGLTLQTTCSGDTGSVTATLCQSVGWRCCTGCYQAPLYWFILRDHSVTLFVIVALLSVLYPPIILAQNWWIW